MSKAQADMISLFFLVAVMLAVVGLFSFFQSSLFVIDYGVDEQVHFVDSSRFMRNSIFKCYGYPISGNMSEVCSSLEENPVLLGWSLEQEDFGYCSNHVFHDRVPEDYSDMITYIVPIMNNETACPGILRLYI